MVLVRRDALIKETMRTGQLNEALSAGRLDKCHQAIAEVITALASAYCFARLELHATKGT